MKVINLQPHPVIFPDGVRIEPSGSIARVEENFVSVGHPITETLGYPIVKQNLENVLVGDLPFPATSKDVYFVVPLDVAKILPLRRDLLIAVGRVHDEAGQIIGYQGLAIANPEPTRHFAS